MTEVESILDLWFGPLEDGFSTDEFRRRWFESTPEFDAEIRNRFHGVLAQAAAGGFREWCTSSRGSLAYIVLTDQFSRQIHRGTAAAFATDHLALAAAQAGLAEEQDRSLEFDERAFFYLPFEHSESLTDQTRSVELFTRLRDETPKGFRHLTGNYLRYAHAHRDIIRRFGRFPHRNASLGRSNTAEESEHLESAHRFGQ